MSYIDVPNKAGKYIKPGDELDLPKAIIYGVTRVKPGTPQVTHVRLSRLRSNTENWEKKAKKLLRDANVPIRNIYTIADLDAMSARFPGHSFHLYSRIVPSRFYKIIHSTSDNGIGVDLMVFKGTYDVFSPSYDKTGWTICPHCKKEYKKQTQHKCKGCCSKCRYPLNQCPIPTEIKFNLVCEFCNRIFYTENCRRNHLKRRGRNHTTCSTFKKCPECNIDYTTRNGEHQCGHRYCMKCFSVQPIHHRCTWVVADQKKKDALLEKQQLFKLVFFDCETVQLRNADDQRSFRDHHFVNFIYYSLVCNECINDDNSFASNCENCGPNKRGFFRHNHGEPENIVAKAFVNMIMFDHTLNNSIVIGHYAGRFDHHFLLPEIFKLNVMPHVIKRGNAIIQVTIQPNRDVNCNNLKLKDSYLYIPQKLQNFSSIFNIDTAKGFFPHLYNLEAHYSTTIDTLPAQRYYDPAHMSPATYSEFKAFYKANKNTRFIFDKMIHDYCKDDVQLLHRGFTAYIRESISMCGWSPVIHASTFASYSFFIIKTDYMQNGQVGVIPDLGYYANQNASIIANKYLQWIEYDQNIQLQTKLKGGEHRIDLGNQKYAYVDGFDSSTNTIYEVLGDFWHGSPEHYKPTTMNPILKQPMGELYRNTMERLDKLASMNYKICAIWESQIHQACASNSAMKEYFETIAHTNRMVPADFLAGGKTQCHRLHAKAEGKNKLFMLDCVSMYPRVLMTTELPVGNPEVITENIPVIKLPLPYQGFYKVDILVPSNVIHPVPWMRIDGKLIFANCRTCAYKRQTARCCHNEQQRKIHCTLYHLELQQALEQGCEILQTFEIWSWTTFQTDLFPSFLKKYLKKKIESSPLPSMTPEQIDSWIRTVEAENLGIEIDRNNLIPNSGLREIAKQAINSVWGKFIEKAVKSQVKFFNIDGDMPEEADDDQYDITDITEMSDEVDMITYQIKKEFATNIPYTSSVIGSITTAGGRVMLNEVLQRVGKRACYVDTDSILFIGDPEVDDCLTDLIGDHIGGWKSEIGEKEELLEFVSTGPKVYAYKYRNAEGKILSKVRARGITHDKSASYDVTFDSIYNLAHKLVRGKMDKIEITRPMIWKKLGTVGTKMMTKQLRPCMDKVKFDNRGHTRGFGYIDGTVFNAISLDSLQPFIQAQTTEDNEQPSTSQAYQGRRN